MKIECPYLSQFRSLKHGFFAPQWEGREHRTFDGLTDSPLPIVTLRQVHGSRVVHVTDPSMAPLEGDGLVTTISGIGLGIFTADCGPVLLYDPHARVIGACHAGWKGAKAGIVRETVALMTDLGADRERIYATLGPTIQQQDYEVGPEFPGIIGEPYDMYFQVSSRPNHYHFNLPLYIKDLLDKEGLAHVHDLGINTFEGDFASRRLSLSQGETSWRDNLSLIAMT